MAVAEQLDFKDGTLDQYDQVIAKMGFSPGGPGGSGGLFHWVTKTDDGIRVTDVWETEEAFENLRSGEDRSDHEGGGRAEPTEDPGLRGAQLPDGWVNCGPTAFDRELEQVLGPTGRSYETSAARGTEAISSRGSDSSTFSWSCGSGSSLLTASSWAATAAP